MTDAIDLATADLNTLFALALPHLQRAGEWIRQGARGDAFTPGPQHWHATVRYSVLDVDVTVRDCGRTERSAGFLLALMQTAAHDGIFLSIGQVQAAAEMDDPYDHRAPRWRVDDLYRATANHAGCWAFGEGERPELAGLRAYLAVKTGQAERLL